MEKIILCSTLHDPEGALPVTECREMVQYLRGGRGLRDWYVSLTPQTYGSEAGQKTAGAFEEIGAKVHEFSKMDGFEPISGNHMYALQTGVSGAGEDDTIVYADGDRLVLGLVHFPESMDMLMESIGRGIGNGEYSPHARSRKAFLTHPESMIVTESVTNNCLSRLTGIRGLDPGSTSHAFSREMGEHVLNESAKNGVHPFPHVDWTMIALSKLRRDEKGPSHALTETGGVYSYETVLYLAPEIERRARDMGLMDPDSGIHGYDTLHELFDKTGMKAEVESREWNARGPLSRISISQEWIGIGLDYASRTEADPRDIEDAMKIHIMINPDSETPENDFREVYETARKKENDYG